LLSLTLYYRQWRKRGFFKTLLTRISREKGIAIVG
jgi:hypothetical protein